MERMHSLLSRACWVEWNSVVYGNITAEALEARGGRTTENYYYPGRNFLAFQVGGMEIKKSARRCELSG